MIEGRTAAACMFKIVSCKFNLVRFLFIYGIMIFFLGYLSLLVFLSIKSEIVIKHMMEKGRYA